MKSVTELKIRDLLVKKVPVETVLQHLLQEMIDPDSKQESILATFALAWNSGLHSLLFEYLPKAFERRRPIHWGVFIEIAASSKAAPNPDVLESIFKGIRRQKLQSTLAGSASWTGWDSRFEEAKQEVLLLARESLERRKALLWEKIHFSRSQRMLEEEGRLLNLMLKLYPEDSEVNKEHKEFEDRWAKNLLQNRASRPVRIERPTARFTAEEQSYIQNLKEFVMTKLLGEDKKNRSTENIYNFALMFLFIGLNNEALEVLALQQQSDPRILWLKLDLLLLSGRHVDLLDHLVQLETLSYDSPELRFAITYYRAQALYGLGKMAQAVELLKGLVNIKPHYRNSSSLLTEYQQEVQG